jgi:hypothetical protein
LHQRLKEIPGASSSQESFHKDYIPPRKDNAPQVKVPVDGKYPLETSPIPPGVSIEGDMLGEGFHPQNCRSRYHRREEFLELAREKYLCTKSMYWAHRR